MAICPFAAQHLISVNYAANAMPNPVMGYVVHHTEGSLDSAEARFSTPGEDASAHFGIDYDGSIRQWVDTKDVAYHACMANWRGWIGVEHRSPAEGDGDVWQKLTDAQVAAGGRLLAWMHTVHGVPIQVTDNQNVGGVAYHDMVPGECSVAWGQTGCPGPNIVSQRQAIVNAALGTSPTPAPPVDPDEDDDMKGSLVKLDDPNAPQVYFLCANTRTKVPNKGVADTLRNSGRVLPIPAGVKHTLDGFELYLSDFLNQFPVIG